MPASPQAGMPGSPNPKRPSVRLERDSNGGFPVWLHVYDLGPIAKWLLNGPLTGKKGLGCFHCGIEVLGIEWTFQAVRVCEDEAQTGVMGHSPKAHPSHMYNQSIWLGSSTMRVSEIGNLLSTLESTWTARSYHFTRRNCTDFAEQFAMGLGVHEQFPKWVHGLAKEAGQAPALEAIVDGLNEGVMVPACLRPTSCSSSCSDGTETKPEDLQHFIFLPGSCKSSASDGTENNVEDFKKMLSAVERTEKEQEATSARATPRSPRSVRSRESS
eukprot:gnl/TRDRNA2_/TRDRNA2_30604_c0_seq1.p1 gnl/TRDRNA2_/TRDRNA2_30604_c0~~gnl/TRDRNA2_/TRDRNA2_30604_c0_seq1.p1  ORF type:complete len:271 (-),score=37.91 gnl/TRDRNA2_/TRDRNA2_30604_c0_seq1:36-848(-)